MKTRRQILEEASEYAANSDTEIEVYEQVRSAYIDGYDEGLKEVIEESDLVPDKATNFWDFANENAFLMFVIVLSLILGPFACNEKAKAQSSKPFKYQDSTKVRKHTRMDTVTGLWKWYKVIDSVK